MTTRTPKTVYVLEDKLGGIASFCSNLISLPNSDSGVQVVIRIHDKLSVSPRIKDLIGADIDNTFSYSTEENIYSTLSRLSAAVPNAPGALVSNSGLELATFCVHEPVQTVYQVVHDAYNLRLAAEFEKVVDIFICHSAFIYQGCLSALPHRNRDIYHLPYGIRLASETRVAREGTLRLVFLGRLTREKGVFDLPRIDARLSAGGIIVHWTIIGDGPARGELMECMPAGARISYASPSTNAEVLALCARGDILVFPTRFEGFPVALLEAMSAGLVPVVSDLESGVPEVVTSETGIRAPVGDAEMFAASIASLHHDRDRLEQMSRSARERARDFDIVKRAAAYHDLFDRATELKRPWGGPVPILHRSRLDRPYFPNWMVKELRRTRAKVASFFGRQS